jgi:hypothetical protein
MQIVSIGANLSQARTLTSIPAIAPLRMFTQNLSWVLPHTDGCFAFEFGKTAAQSVTPVEEQRLNAQVRRLVEMLGYLGAPLSAAEKKRLNQCR